MQLTSQIKPLLILYSILFNFKKLSVLKKKNIAILMGGYSSEYEVSIKSGNEVYKNLDKKKYNLYRIIITKNKWFYLNENKIEIPVNIKNFSLRNPKVKFDLVYNVIHGSPGEDGLIQSYFKLIGINHTSTEFFQSALTFNKNDCKEYLKNYGVISPNSLLLRINDKIDQKKIMKKINLPVFVKPNKGGSSFGISRVDNIKKLIPAIQHAFKEDNEIIIEEEIKGKEISVGIMKLNNKIISLPPTEIISHNEFFDYDAKYKGKSDEITPALINSNETNEVQKLSRLIYKKLKLKGFARSDFILKHGKFYFLEVNTNPGLTKESIFPKQAKSFGISLKELFESLIK